MKLKLNALVIFFLIMTIFTSGAKAVDTEEGDYKNMEQMMGAIRLEKKQVESMVDKMVVSGRISPDEGDKAKREIASMKDSDLENLKTQAIAVVNSNKLLDH